MAKSLRKAFDFQKFANNPRLAAMIADTESRYGKSSRQELSDDDLFMVNAAGTPDVPDEKDPFKEDK